MRKQEEKLRKQIPFTTAIKIMKYLGMYLPKETEDLYRENLRVGETTQSVGD